MANQPLAKTTARAGLKPADLYDHARYEPMRRVLRWASANIGWTAYGRIGPSRISGLENLPATGPAILMINHIAFIDPIVVMGNLPRNIVPLAKAEVYRI